MWQQRIAREARHKRKPIPRLRISPAFPDTYLPSNPNLLRDLPFHHTSSPHSIVSTCTARLNLSHKPPAPTHSLLFPKNTDKPGLSQAYQTWSGPSLGKLAVQAPLGLARSRQFIEASVRRSLEADLRQTNTPKSLSSASIGQVQELQTLLGIERKVVVR